MQTRIWLSPYNYVQNNPIMRIDANGASDTKYVDEDDVTIKNTADGCNDVVVVDDNQVDKVKNTLNQAEMQGRINDPSFNQTLTSDIKSNYPSGPQAYVSYSAEIYFGITGGSEISSSMGNISLKGSMPAATIWGGKTEISNNGVSTNFNWFGKGGEFKTKFGGAAELGGGVKVEMTAKNKFSGGSNSSTITTEGGAYGVFSRTVERAHSTTTYTGVQQKSSNAFIIGYSANFESGVMVKTIK